MRVKKLIAIVVPMALAGFSADAEILTQEMGQGGEALSQYEEVVDYAPDGQVDIQEEGEEAEEVIEYETGDGQQYGVEIDQAVPNDEAMAEGLYEQAANYDQEVQQGTGAVEGEIESPQALTGEAQFNDQEQAGDIQYIYEETSEEVPGQAEIQEDYGQEDQAGGEDYPAVEVEQPLSSE